MVDLNRLIAQYDAVQAKRASNEPQPLAPITDPQALNNINLGEQAGANYLASLNTNSPDAVDPLTREIAETPESELAIKYGPETAHRLKQQYYNSASTYADSQTNSRSGRELLTDTLAHTAGGLADIATGAVNIGAAGVDTALNLFRENDNYNFTKNVANVTRHVSDFFHDTLQSNSNVAQNFARMADSAARDAQSEHQYQQDLANGEGYAISALSKLGRDALNGVKDFMSDPANAVGSSVGSVGGTGFLIKGTAKMGTKLASKLANSKSPLLNSLTNFTEETAKVLNKAYKKGDKAAIANAMKDLTAVDKAFLTVGSAAITNAALVGGEGVSNAIQELDNISDNELIDGSPTAKLFYNSYLDQGYSDAEARKLMRQRVEADVILPSMASYALAGAVSGKLFDKILKNPFIVNTKIGQSYLSNINQQGLEESFESMPRVALNAALQPYDQDRSLIQGVGQDVGAGYVGGALGTAVGTPIRPITNLTYKSGKKLFDATVGNLLGSGKKNKEDNKNKAKSKDNKEPMEDTSEGLNEFNRAMEDSDTTAMSSNAVNAGVDSINENEENLSDTDKEFVHNFKLDEESQEDIDLKNNLIKSARDANVNLSDEVDKEGNPTVNIKTRADLLSTAANGIKSMGIVQKDGVYKKQDKEGNIIDLGEKDYRFIDAVENVYENADRKLTYPADNNYTSENAKVNKLAKWVSDENANHTIVRKTLGDISYNRFTKVSSNISNIENKINTGVKLDSKDIGDIKQATLFAIRSLRDLDNISGSTNKEGQRVEYSNIERIQQFLGKVTKGLKSGTLGVDEEDTNLWKHAKSTQIILNSYKSILEKEAALNNVTSGIATVNTEKQGDKNSDIGLAKDFSSTGKPSATTHISRMLRAVLSNDGMAYNAARNEYDKFLASQQKKLIDYARSYDIYRRNKSKSSGTLEVRGAPYQITNETVAKELLNAMLLENAFMITARNTLEMDMYGDDMSRAKWYTPYSRVMVGSKYLQGKKLFTSTNINSPENITKAEKKILNLLVGLRGIDTENKDAKLTYKHAITKSISDAFKAMRQVDLAAPISDSAPMATSQEPSEDTSIVSDTNNLFDENDETSTLFKDDATPTTTTTPTAESTMQQSEPAEPVGDAGKIDNSIGLDDIDNVSDSDIETISDVEYNTSSLTDSTYGSSVKQVPVDPNKIIDVGDRNVELASSAYDSLNKLKSDGSSETENSIKDIISDTQNTILASNPQNEELNHNNINFKPKNEVNSSSNLKDIVSHLWTRFVGGKGSHFSEPIDSVIQNFKADNNNPRVINNLDTLEDGFDKFYEKANKTFKDKQELFTRNLRDITSNLCKEVLALKNELNNNPNNTNLQIQINEKNNAIRDIIYKAVTNKMDDRNVVINGAIDQKVIDKSINNPWLLLSDFPSTFDFQVNSEGNLEFTGDLQLNRDLTKVFFLALKQELCNARNSATDTVDLNGRMWEGASFRDYSLKEIQEQWSYATQANTFVEKVANKVMGYMNIKPNNAATEAESKGTIQLITMGLMDLMSKHTDETNGLFRITDAINPAFLKGTVTNENAKTINVIKFTDKDGTPIDTLYQPDVNQRSSNLIDKLFDYRQDSGIHLGQQGLEDINKANLADKRLHASNDRIGSYATEAVKDRQEQAYIPNREMFKQYFSIDRDPNKLIDKICLFNTGVPRKDVDEYFEFERIYKLLKDKKQFYEKEANMWKSFCNKYGITPNGTIDQQILNYVETKHVNNFQYMSKLRSRQDAYRLAIETASELLTEMRETYNKIHSTSIGTNEDFLFNSSLTDDDFREVAQHYAYQITLSGRLQEINAKATPVTNKVMRELFTNMEPVTVNKRSLTGEFKFTDDTDNNTFVTWGLSIAQAFGEKLWSKGTRITDVIQIAIDDINRDLGVSLRNRLNQISNSLDTNNIELSDQDMIDIKNFLSSHGYDVNPLSLHAVMDLIKYDNSSDSSDFQSTMYIEVDARSSGPSNIISRFGTDPFSEANINLMESTGFMVLTTERPSDILSHVKDSKLSDDFYQNTANKTVDTMSKDYNGIYRKKAKAIHNALIRVFSTVTQGKILKIDTSNGEVKITKASRQFGKSGATPISYGSGIMGIAHQILSDFLSGPAGNPDAGLYALFNRINLDLTKERSHIFDNAITGKDKQNAMLKFIGRHIFTDLNEKELIDTTKSFLKDFDLAFTQNLDVQTAANGSASVQAITNTGTDPLFRSLYEDTPKTSIDNNTFINRFSELFRDASKFDKDSEVLQKNIQIAIADPLWRSTNELFGTDVQETSQTLKQLTNAINLIKSMVDSVLKRNLKSYKGNDSSLSNNDNRNMQRTKLYKATTNMKVKFGYTGSEHYPAYNESRADTGTTNLARFTFTGSDKNVTTYSETIYDELGVAGSPGTIQAFGDADIVNQLTHLLNKLTKILTVFDGINIPLNKLEDVSTDITTAIYNSNKQNIYNAFLDIANEFAKFFNDNPAFLDSSNTYSLVNSDLGLYFLSLLLPSNLHETFILGNSNYSLKYSLTQYRNGSSYIKPTASDIVNGLNTAIEKFQEKAVMSQARISVFHGLPKDMLSKLPMSGNYDTYEDTGMFFGSYNMDSYGSSDQVNQSSVNIDGNTYSRNEWDRLASTEKIKLLNSRYEQNRNELTKNKDSLFPKETASLPVGSPSNEGIKPIDTERLLSDLFKYDKSNKKASTNNQQRSIRNVLNALLGGKNQEYRNENTFINGSQLLANSKIYAFRIANNEATFTDQLKNIGFTDEESKQCWEDYNKVSMNGTKSVSAFVYGNTIILNSEPNSIKNIRNNPVLQTSIIHELIHIGTRDAIAKGFRDISNGIDNTQTAMMVRGLQNTTSDLLNSMTNDLITYYKSLKNDENIDKFEKTLAMLGTIDTSGLSDKELSKHNILRALLRVPATQDEAKALHEAKKNLVGFLYFQSMNSAKDTSREEFENQMADMLDQLGMVASGMDTSSTDSLINNEVFIHEAVAWVKSASQIEEYTRRKYASATTGKFIREFFSKYWNRIKKSIFRYINSLLGIGEQESIQKRLLENNDQSNVNQRNITIDDSFTTLIVGLSNTVLRQKDLGSHKLLNQVTSEPMETDTRNLIKLEKMLTESTNKILDERRTYDANRVSSKLAQNKMYRDQMVSQLPSFGFKLSAAQESLVRSVYMAVAMGIKSDTAVYRQLSTTFTKALGAFNQDYFTPENRRDNPNDTRRALMKYRFLMGNYSVSDSTSPEKSVRLLPTFVALSLVDPDLRTFFSEQPNVINEPFSSSNSLEQSIVRGVTKATEAVMKLNSQKNSNMAQLVDTYIDSIIDDDKDGNFALTKLNGLTDALDNAIDKTESYIGSKFIDALPRRTFKFANKLAKSKNRAKALLGTSLQLVSLPKQFIENEGYTRMDILNKEVLQWKDGIVTSFIKNQIREYMSRTPRTKDFLIASKRAKEQIDIKASKYRVDIPKLIEQSFEGIKKKDWRHITYTLGKCDLTSLVHLRNEPEQLAELLSNKETLANTLRDAYRDIFTNYQINPSEVQKYTKPLGRFMATGRFSNDSTNLGNVQRNSDAIVYALRANLDMATANKLRQDLDSILAMEALTHTDMSHRMFTARLLRNPKYTEAFKELWDTVAQRKQYDRDALIQHNQILNRWQGYIPSIPTNDRQVRLIDENNEDAMKYAKLCGYKKIADYKNSVSDTKHKFAYYECPVNPEAAYMGGALQNLNFTAGGVNLETGLTHNAFNSDFIGLTGRSTNKSTEEELQEDASAMDVQHRIDVYGNNNSVLVPIYRKDRSGVQYIVGYERTLDPKYTTDVVATTEHFPSIVGYWMGRQNSEDELAPARMAILQELKNMYDRDAGSLGLYDSESFVNILDPKFYKDDSILSESVKKYFSYEGSRLYRDSQKVFDPEGKSKTPILMVRKDLIPQVIGQRRASIADIFTGNTRLNKTFCNAVGTALNAIFGSGNLIKWERKLQRFVVAGKTNIVVKSISVPADNIVSNLIELNMLGVPASEIQKNLVNTVRECETYVRYQQELIKLEYRESQQTADAVTLEKIAKRKQEIEFAIKDLDHIYPLIEMGEFNMLSDIGTIREDMGIPNGTIGDMLDKAIENLPEDYQNGLKQLVVSKDTQLYQVLTKATQYGDFVAKSILYNDILRRRKLGRDVAEYQASTFFVDYDILPSRTRDYLESIGLMWFYNYKLRMSKVLMYMLANNPVKLLLWSALPLGLGFDLLNTPLRDSALGRVLGFGPSLGSTALFGAPSMFYSALTSNPWIWLFGILF